MAEKDLWATMRDHLKRYGDFQRVENMVGSGIPDVNYCLPPGVEGWVELKQTQGWPRDPMRPLALDHYTPQQRLWHKRRRSAGGRVFVLLQIVKPCEYILLDARWAAIHLGLTATQRDIKQAALVLGLHTFPERFVMEMLKGFTFPAS